MQAREWCRDLAESPPLPADITGEGSRGTFQSQTCLLQLVPHIPVIFLGQGDILDPEGPFPNLACDLTKLQVTPLAQRLWRDPQVLLWQP